MSAKAIYRICNYRFCARACWLEQTALAFHFYSLTRTSEVNIEAAYGRDAEGAIISPVFAAPLVLESVGTTVVFQQIILNPKDQPFLYCHSRRCVVRQFAHLHRQ